MEAASDIMIAASALLLAVYLWYDSRHSTETEREVDTLAINGHRVTQEQDGWVCTRCRAQCNRLREYRELYCDGLVETVSGVQQ